MLTKQYKQFLLGHYQQVIENFENQPNPVLKKTKEEVIGDFLSDIKTEMDELKQHMRELEEKRKLLISLIDVDLDPLSDVERVFVDLMNEAEEAFIEYQQYREEKLDYLDHLARYYAFTQAMFIVYLNLIKR